MSAGSLIHWRGRSLTTEICALGSIFGNFTARHERSGWIECNNESLQ